MERRFDYENYHKHTHYSNIRTLDSIAKPEEYIDRAIELGQTSYFTGEHGYQGFPFEILNILEKKNKDLPEDKKIKMRISAEAYFSIEEKDRTSYHIVLVALNNSGVEQINKVLSKANTDGFYFKPRINQQMIEEIIDPKDVIITTACVAGFSNKRNPKAEELVQWFSQKFGNNFYLEVQAHDVEIQKSHNKDMLEYHYKYGIELIHANDSHYIYPEDSVYRSKFLKAKGMVYPDEDNFILDYPSGEEIYNRYKKQGVLSDEQIAKALKNTLVFREKCKPITIYNTDIKLPKVSENPNKDLKEIVNNEWKKISVGMTDEEKRKYIKAIKDEVKIIEDTGMETYFVLDYLITKKAVDDYGCLVTKTGRGSAGSFLINKFLGLTGLDRITSPVTLYPTRFMSTTRILETKSLPDIDINTSDQSALIKASEDIIGKEKCGWMITFKPLQEASAFRLWCKANNYDFDEYNEFAKEIAEQSKRGCEDYKEDEKWKDVIEESKRFKGVIESISPSPCSILLSTEDVDKHVGLIKIKDVICCNLDGYNCDKYKYLKNDYLKIIQLEIVEKVYKLIGKPVPNIEELEKLLDDKTYDIYKNKLTCTINQADSDFATELVSKYNPRSVSELCAFVAGIRPGFASLLNNFINREKYSTGVKELDDLLEDSFHYMLYQESIMKYLIWLGIEESESYTILKKISKKKFKGDELTTLKKKLHKGWVKVVGREDGFEETWKVVEDASRYSFNASHSLAYAYDSLYGAYLKSHYPLEYYAVVLNIYQNDMTRTTKLIRELDHFGIKLNKPLFRYSKAEYFFDKETNSIYKGVESIKYLNKNVGDMLYSLRNRDVDFYDILEIGGLDSRKIKILIKLDYFKEFGGSAYLLRYYDVFKKYHTSKNINKNNLDFPLSVVEGCYENETPKMFRGINNRKLIENIMTLFDKNEEIPLTEKIQTEMEYCGSVTPIQDIEGNRCLVSEVKEFNRNYVVTLTNLKVGATFTFKQEKKLLGKLKPLDVIDLVSVTKLPKNVKIDGKWKKSTTEYDYWISGYNRITD